MQALGPTSTGHQATRKLINDNNLAIFYYILFLAMKNNLRFERLLKMVDVFHSALVINILNTQQLLHFFDANLVNWNCFFFNIDDIVFAFG